MVQNRGVKPLLHPGHTPNILIEMGGDSDVSSIVSAKEDPRLFISLQRSPKHFGQTRLVEALFGDADHGIVESGSIILRYVDSIDFQKG